MGRDGGYYIQPKTLVVLLVGLGVGVEMDRGGYVPGGEFGEADGFWGGHGGGYYRRGRRPGIMSC